MEIEKRSALKISPVGWYQLWRLCGIFFRVKEFLYPEWIALQDRSQCMLHIEPLGMALLA